MARLIVIVLTLVLVSCTRPTSLYVRPPGGTLDPIARAIAASAGGGYITKNVEPSQVAIMAVAYGAAALLFDDEATGLPLIAPVARLVTVMVSHGGDGKAFATPGARFPADRCARAFAALIPGAVVVPYRSGGDAIMAVLRGDVPFAFTGARADAERLGLTVVKTFPECTAHLGIYGQDDTGMLKRAAMSDAVRARVVALGLEPE